MAMGRSGIDQINKELFALIIDVQLFELLDAITMMSKDDCSCSAAPAFGSTMVSWQCQRQEYNECRMGVRL